MSRRPPNFDTPPARILIIKPSAIGDVVHTLPVLNLLRRRWPAANIAWLLTPACAGLLQGHPQLDEIIPFDRRRFGNAWKSPTAAAALAKFSARLFLRRFDLVVDLQGLFRSGLLSIQTGARTRVGSSADREFGWVFNNHLAPTRSTGRHAVDRYLDVAEYLGLGRSPVEFKFHTDAADEAHVDTLVPAEKFAVFLPATNWPTKRWPVDKFAALTRPLRDRFGLRAVLAGGPQDAALAPDLPGVVDVAGKTTLRQLVALLRRADLVVGNDTGPMHIAAALGRPLVTPFGPTTPAHTGPYNCPDSVVRLDLPCSPCFSRRCSHHTCLRELPVEPVLAVAEAQLRRSAGS